MTHQFTPAFDRAACFNIKSAIAQKALNRVPLKIILGKHCFNTPYVNFFQQKTVFTVVIPSSKPFY